LMLKEISMVIAMGMISSSGELVCAEKTVYMHLYCFLEFSEGRVWLLYGSKEEDMHMTRHGDMHQIIFGFVSTNTYKL
jgi:hypothetical protein